MSKAKCSCCTRKVPEAVPTDIPPPRRQLARPTDSIFDLLLAGTHDSSAYYIDSTVTSRSSIRPLRNRIIRNATGKAVSDVSVTQALKVNGQLLAGVRFLDLRVSKLDPSWKDDRFWTVHGMSVCVPFDDIIDQINAFHEHIEKEERRPDEFPIPVVSVVRPLDLTDSEIAELASHIKVRLRGGIFSGSANELRTMTLADLPRNVVIGIPEIAIFPSGFGWDAFIDTYKADVKIKFLLEYITSLQPRRSRQDLSVVGWTVTPQLKDVVFRILSVGPFRRTLRTEAIKMDQQFRTFAESHRDVLASSVNVVFCDFMDTSFANEIINISNSTLQGTTVG